MCEDDGWMGDLLRKRRLSVGAFLGFVLHVVRVVGQTAGVGRVITQN